MTMLQSRNVLWGAWLLCGCLAVSCKAGEPRLASEDRVLACGPDDRAVGLTEPVGPEDVARALSEGWLDSLLGELAHDRDVVMRHLEGQRMVAAAQLARMTDVELAAFEARERFLREQRLAARYMRDAVPTVPITLDEARAWFYEHQHLWLEGAGTFEYLVAETTADVAGVIADALRDRSASWRMVLDRLRVLDPSARLVRLRIPDRDAAAELQERLRRISLSGEVEVFLLHGRTYVARRLPGEVGGAAFEDHVDEVLRRMMAERLQTSFRQTVEHLRAVAAPDVGP